MAGELRSVPGFLLVVFLCLPVQPARAQGVDLFRTTPTFDVGDGPTAIVTCDLNQDGRPDVVTHLRALLPAPWQATLCAVDGNTTGDLVSQLPNVPSNATHLVVSLGGNDALLNADLLDIPVSSTLEALRLFHERIAQFERRYRSAIGHVIGLQRRTTICTVYNGNLEPAEADAGRMVLTLFNDVILRTALARGLPVIDLRTVCDQPDDYANSIEPSDSGGRKIAEAVAQAIGAIAPTRARSSVWGPARLD